MSMSGYRPDPPRTPGMEYFHAVAFGGSGATPQSVSLKLPGPGIYQATVRARMNGGELAVVHAVISWNQTDGLNVSSVLSTALGTAGAAGNNITSMTLAAPTADGTVVIALAWNRADFNRATWASWNLRTLMDAGQLTAYPG